MSRTWNTAPYLVRKRRGLTANRAWWSSANHSTTKYWARRRNRQARHQAQAELGRGDQPAAYRPRHSAEWDAH